MSMEHLKNMPVAVERTSLKYLGIDGMSKEELLLYLNEGVYTR